MPKRGKLIITAGFNGVGKDTIAPLLAKWMCQTGVPTEYLYGPETNKSTAALQDVVLQTSTCPHSLSAQALTFLALHTEAAEVKIIPTLEKGVSIVLNRGPETTLVYNVIGRELALQNPLLLSLYEQINGLLKPDLVMVLDTSVDIALSRAARQQQSDWIQEEDRAKHEKRRRIYLQLATQYGWSVVDATPPIEQVLERALLLVNEILRRET